MAVASSRVLPMRRRSRIRPFGPNRIPNPGGDGVLDLARYRRAASRAGVLPASSRASMKSVTHQSTLHLCLKIKCCIDRLSRQPNIGSRGTSCPRLVQCWNRSSLSRARRPGDRRSRRTDRNAAPGAWTRQSLVRAPPGPRISAVSFWVPRCLAAFAPHTASSARPYDQSLWIQRALLLYVRFVRSPSAAVAPPPLASPALAYPVPVCAQHRVPAAARLEKPEPDRYEQRQPVALAARLA